MSDVFLFVITSWSSQKSWKVTSFLFCLPLRVPSVPETVSAYKNRTKCPFVREVFYIFGGSFHCTLAGGATGGREVLHLV